MKKLCKDCGVKKKMDGRSICTTCFGRRYVKKQPKEVRKTYMRKVREKRRDGKWRVYCLPYHNYYVGQTIDWYDRNIVHKSRGIDTTDYFILHKCKTRKEALEYEKIYHKLGFPGKKMA